MGHGRPRTLPHHHGVVLPRRARGHPRLRRVESRVVRGAPALAGGARELRPTRSRQNHRREQARQGILPPGADVRSGGVRGPRGVSLCRGVCQDGRGRDRGIQRRRHAHHRYALAVERGEAHQDKQRSGTSARCKSHEHSREHAREHRPVTGAGRGGGERLFVLAHAFLLLLLLLLLAPDTRCQGTSFCLASIIIIFTILTMLVLSCTIPSRRVSFIRGYDNFYYKKFKVVGQELLSSFFVPIMRPGPVCGVEPQEPSNFEGKIASGVLVAT